jgi:hypothetical protein
VSEECFKTLTPVYQINAKYISTEEFICYDVETIEEVMGASLTCPPN